MRSHPPRAGRPLPNITDRANQTSAVASRRRRILVIEDDYSTRHLLEIVLRARGYDVASAGDARDGLAILDTRHVDLILLDLVLPGASGIDFLRARRDMPPSVQAPVIVISALPELDAIRTELRYLGAETAIRKPFDVEELMSALDAHSRRRVSRARAHPAEVPAQA